MEYSVVMDALRSYEVVGGWPPSIFLLPEAGMREIYDCIVSEQLRACLELGSGHGATSCVMAAAAEETGGRVTTVDRVEHQPANARALQAHAKIGGDLEVVVDPLGYNWWMAELIERQTVDDQCEPLFDLCFLDGAHEWLPDALAVYLAVKLLRPGGWLVIDDLDFHLRGMPWWRETHGHLSDRELDTYQIHRVWQLVVRQHPELTNFRETLGGRIGWAQKQPAVTPAVPTAVLSTSSPAESPASSRTTPRSPLARLLRR